VTFVSLSMGDRDLDGVIEEIRDDDGRITEVTLMLRPLDAPLAAVERMRQPLEAAPLSSGAQSAGRDEAERK
jgi:hypothetical protein